MFLSDMTTTTPTKTKTGDVIVLTLTANGLDPFFVQALKDRLSSDEYTFRFVDIKSKSGSLNTAIVRLVSYGGPTTLDAVNYVISQGNDVKNITLWGLEVTHVEIMSNEQAKQQDIIEQKQQDIKAGDTTNQTVWDKIFGSSATPKSWGESLFGISGNQLLLLVGGLGAFLIWTKLPSFKGRR